MIPVLYEKSERNFSHNGIGFLSDAEKATVTEERNGIFELSMQYPLGGIWFDRIETGSIIKAKANETSKPQLFRVYKISKPLQGVVTYSAEHISYDLNGIPTLGLNLDSSTAEAAMAQAVSGAVSPCEYSVFSDITDKRPVAVEPAASVRSAFGSIRDTFGGEFEFDNFEVKLHKSRGKDNGVSIEYGKNLTDLKQDNNISECYTHIMPFAHYEKEPEEYDENAEPETVYIYLSEKIMPISGAENFGRIKIFPVDFSDRFEEGAEYTESALRILANDFLSDTDIGIPKVSLSISFVQLWQTEEYKNIAPLERVRLCDIVTVKFPRLGIKTKSEVVKTVYDVLSERYESVDLGDVKETLADTIIESEKELRTIKKSTDRIESHIRRTDDRITLEVLHIVENEKELSSRIELTESAITAEVSRATAEEGRLSGKIELTAENLTSTFEAKIKEESDRAESVERELSSTITQTAESLTSTFTEKITTESDRAQKAEETLSSTIAQTAESISAEVTRAKGAEEELSGKIELTAESLTSTFEAKVKEETDRAESVEETLSSTITQTAESISAEVTRAKGTEAELSSKVELTAESLTSEISRATAEEGELSSRIAQTAESISSEITRAKNAESTLSSKITQTVNAIRLSVSSSVSGDETVTTLSITNGSATLNSVKITGTTAKQAAEISADAVKGIKLSHTTSTANNQTTSTLTLKNGSATLSTASIIGTTAEQAATIAADAVKGISLSVSNSTTGTSSTLTLKSGSATLSSAKIEFTGLVTFANLKDGKTEISGDNITTGKISAERIDTDSLYVDKIYTVSGSRRYAALYTNGANLYIGGDTSTVNWKMTYTYICATNYVYLGSAWGGTNSLVVETANRILRPYTDGNYSGYAWYLGQSNYRFSGIYTYNLNANGFVCSNNMIGFFGTTPHAKTTVSTISSTSTATTSTIASKVNDLINALKNYGLV